jgi:hypothetical protein
LALFLLAGCDSGLADKPTRVHVSRVITQAGDRVVSYTAMYDDGIETYIDYDPQGDVDMITVERESKSDGSMLRLVRDGFTPKSEPANGPKAEAITDDWAKRFVQIDKLVDVDLVQWSDAHGAMTPDQLEQPGGGH